MQKTKEKLNAIYSELTGQSPDKVAAVHGARITS
jgi:hypothetical protein